MVAAVGAGSVTQKFSIVTLCELEFLFVVTTVDIIRVVETFENSVVICNKSCAVVELAMAMAVVSTDETAVKYDVKGIGWILVVSADEENSCIVEGSFVINDVVECKSNVGTIVCSSVAVFWETAPGDNVSVVNNKVLVPFVAKYSTSFEIVFSISEAAVMSIVAFVSVIREVKDENMLVGCAPVVDCKNMSEIGEDSFGK